MSNEPELVDAVAQAEEAKQILNSRAWRNAEENIQNFALEKMVEHHQDPEALKEVAYALFIHKKYREVFEVAIETGTLAAVDLEIVRQKRNAA